MGDTVYGGGSTQFEKKHPRLFEDTKAGQALFAMSLGFDHPQSKAHMTFCAPEPIWMSDILKLLRDTAGE